MIYFVGENGQMSGKKKVLEFVKAKPFIFYRFFLC